MAGVQAEQFTGFRPLVPPPPKPESGELESGSESDNGGKEGMDSQRLDASHREILEKLKRQEQEERAEIERELREAQMEALERVRRHEEFRAQELRAQEMRAEDLRTRQDGERSSPSPLSSSGGSGRDQSPNPDNDTPVSQTEIRHQRPQGLLAQHGLSTKHHHPHHTPNHMLLNSGIDLAKERERLDRERLERLERLSMVAGGDRHHDFLAAAHFPHHPAFGDRFRRTPPSAPSPPPNDLDDGPLINPEDDECPDSRPGSVGSPGQPGHNWTFEEQFKQLYELSDDAKRKEFLDDLFSFMQKRGTPVNRIPIMAKQTLDLYELFRLVISKGGLVEVINKKLWREITKGLNLPSSITSAAFTLRTQYMKYLYPYECEKLKLSNPSELQAAIDGNRREGRRPSYGYDFSPVPTMIPTTPPHLNGAGLLNGRPDWTAYWKHLSGVDDEPLLPPGGPAHLRSLAERDARAMEAATRAMEEAQKRISEAQKSDSNKISQSPLDVSSHTPSILDRISIPPTTGPPSHSNGMPRDVMAPLSTNQVLKTEPSEPPRKRPLMEEDRLLAPPGLPSSHIKITSRGDGRGEFDNSMVVSMEINGIMYQGVLFAQHHHRRI